MFIARYQNRTINISLFKFILIFISLMFLYFSSNGQDEVKWNTLCISGRANSISMYLQCKAMQEAYPKTISLASPSSLRLKGERFGDYNVNYPKEPNKYKKYTDAEVIQLWQSTLNFHNMNRATEISQYLIEPSKNGYLMFLVNHGASPKGVKQDIVTGVVMRNNLSAPMNYIRKTSGVIFEKEFLEYEKLKSSILDQIDPKKKLMIVVEQCYGGSIHDITFERNNTCSVSTANWLVPSFTDRIINPDNNFILSFTEEKKRNFSQKKFDFDKDGKTDMIEAYLAGVFSDSLNFGRATISSMAYIDYKLKKGKYSNNPYLLDDQDILPRRKSMICKEDPKKEISWMKEILLKLNQKKQADDEDETINEIRYYGGYNEVDHNLTASEYAVLPKKLLGIYEKLIHNKKFLEEADKVKNKVPLLQKMIFSLQQKYNLLSSKENKTKEELKKEKEYEDDLRRRQKVMNEMRAPLRGALRFLEYLKKIAIFYKKYEAGSKERAKFENILACEFSEL